jgi:hypothetical protein
MWGHIEEYEGAEPVLLGTSIAGDLSTPRDSLAVWTNAAGPKFLVEADVVNNDGAVRYLMIFGDNTFADGQVPIEQFKVGIGATKNFKFGRNGRVVIRETSTGTFLQGCYLVWSTTTGVLTQVGGSSSYIQAYYRAQPQ